MAKYTEFYKGRRKRRSYVFIPAAIVLGLISLVLVMFYGMQKYAVITKDDVAIKLPMLAGDEEETTIDAQGNEVKVFEPVEANIVFDSPDYSGVQPVAGENVEAIRGIFVPYTELNREKISEYAARLKLGNALVLEMKPRIGKLMWNSQSSVARNYGLTSDEPTEIQSIIDELKENGAYLAAQISVCLDERFASYSSSVTLKTEYGADYRDDEGVWLDAYNMTLRTYVVELCRELYAMGFDEVVLADVMHPVIPEPEEGKEKLKLTYTRDMSTEPSPVNAVCGFAVSVAGELSDREGLLSIYCNSARALAYDDNANGQNAELFMKVFDRVYYNTDKYTYTFNFSDIENSVDIGSAEYRFVPVVINYLPDNSDQVSWVLVDKEEKKD